MQYFETYPFFFYTFWFEN